MSNAADEISDNDLGSEVRELSSEVAALAVEVRDLSDVQERRRYETLELAAALRVETIQIAVVQRDLTRRRTRVVAGFLLAFLVAGVIFGSLVVVALRSNQADIKESNQKFCALLSQSAASSPAPTTPRGESIQQGALDLYRSLGCVV